MTTKNKTRKRASSEEEIDNLVESEAGNDDANGGDDANASDDPNSGEFDNDVTPPAPPPPPVAMVVPDIAQPVVS